MLKPIGLSQIGYGIPQHRLPPKDKPLKLQQFKGNDIYQPDKVSINYNTIIQSTPDDYHSGYEVRPYDSKLYEEQVKKQLISSFVKLYDKQGKQYLPQDEKDKELTNFLRSLTSIKGDLVKKADDEAKSLLGLGKPDLTEHGVGEATTEDIIAPEAEAEAEAERIKNLKERVKKLTEEPILIGKDLERAQQKFEEEQEELILSDIMARGTKRPRKRTRGRNRKIRRMNT